MTKARSNRIKVDAAEFDIPQTHEECCESIAAIGRAQRERDRIQAKMNDDLANIRARYEEAAKPHADEIKARTQGVATYCEAHRDQLTKGGKRKTAKLATGEVSWRMRPPSVSVRGKEAVINALRKFGNKFLRVKEDVDKDAVLREPEAVKGIKGLSITQREDFVVKPDNTELEEVR